jgi:hypothetical protein
VIYALNPKKYTNYIMQKNFLKKYIGKNLETKLIFFKLQDLFTEKKTLILKSNQINFVKTKRKVMSLTFVRFL